MTISQDKLAEALLLAFEAVEGGEYVRRDEYSDDYAVTLDGHFSLLRIAAVALALLSERPEQ